MLPTLDERIELLPDDLQRYLFEFGIIQKNKYVTENGVFQKKHIYEFRSKLKLDNDTFYYLKWFLEKGKRSNLNIFIKPYTGTISITKIFPKKRTVYSWQEDWVRSKLIITYKNDCIYYEYSYSCIDELNNHIVRVYDNGEILFTYAPLVSKKQNIIRNKLHVKSNFII